MNVYTYYENINFSKQENLIEVWKKSWEDKGFKATVLTRKDAESHSFFDKFCEKLKQLHLDIVGKELQDYGLSCYLRWLAYANTLKEPSFVCDYDVINIRLENNHKIDNKLNFYDNCCPCFASGTAKQFLAFCLDILRISDQNLNSLKGNVQPWYHDQEFIAHNEFQVKNLSYIHVDGRDPNERLVQLYKHQDSFITNNSKVLHFAHASIGQTKENFPELKDQNSDELKKIFQTKLDK